MDDRIEEILDALRPGIKAEGGVVEQLSPGEDGSIRICLKEACSMCYARLWTHRLKIERTIKESYPQAKVIFVRGRNQGNKNAG